MNQAFEKLLLSSFEEANERTSCCWVKARGLWLFWLISMLPLHNNNNAQVFPASSPRGGPNGLTSFGTGIYAARAARCKKNADSLHSGRTLHPTTFREAKTGIFSLFATL
jgi:hypothetical protein